MKVYYYETENLTGPRSIRAWNDHEVICKLHNMPGLLVIYREIRYNEMEVIWQSESEIARLCCFFR
jgi:hypothetical protein